MPCLEKVIARHKWGAFRLTLSCSLSMFPNVLPYFSNVLPTGSNVVPIVPPMFAMLLTMFFAMVSHPPPNVCRLSMLFQWLPMSPPCFLILSTWFQMLSQSLPMSPVFQHFRNVVSQWRPMFPMVPMFAPCFILPLWFPMFSPFSSVTDRSPQDTNRDLSLDPLGSVAGSGMLFLRICTAPHAEFCERISSPSCTNSHGSKACKA